METIRAGAGRFLRKGDCFAEVVNLGVNDSADNWTEVDASEREEHEARMASGAAPEAKDGGA